jgi:hypothetical protein
MLPLQKKAHKKLLLQTGSKNPNSARFLATQMARLIKRDLVKI